MHALADAGSKNNDFSGLAMFNADIFVLDWNVIALKATHEEMVDATERARTAVGIILIADDLRVVWYSTFRNL